MGLGVITDSSRGERNGELFADDTKILCLISLASLISLYCQSGGKGDLLGGPSGNILDRGGGEQLGVGVVGDVTKTQGLLNAGT